LHELIEKRNGKDRSERMEIVDWRSMWFYQKVLEANGLGFVVDDGAANKLTEEETEFAFTNIVGLCALFAYLPAPQETTWRW
jgi:hypothetical protein